MDSGRTRLQKSVLILLTAMILLFGVLTAISRTRKGVVFEDALLRVTASEGCTIYTGKAHGEDVTITVTGDGKTTTTVEYAVGDLLCQICAVEYPLAPVQTSGGPVNGIRVSRGGELLFEGGCDLTVRSDLFNCMLYTPDGELAVDALLDLRLVAGNDYWGGYEPGVGSIIGFALAPELQARGSWAIYAMAVMLALMAMGLTAFPRAIFQFRHSWYVKNPEPTEAWFMAVWMGVALLAVMALIFFNLALRTIP